MEQRPVYNEPDGKWYKLGDEPFRVRVVTKGEKFMPVVGVEASSFGEAFEKLYGYPPLIPAPVRAPRKENEL